MPPRGTYWVRKGEPFAYAFTATTGFRLSVARADGVERTPTGTLTVGDSIVLEAISLPDTAVAARTSYDAELERIAGLGNPVPSLERWEAAYSTADSAGRADMDRAHFAVLMRMGPDRWFDLVQRIERNQDTRDVTMGREGAALVGLIPEDAPSALTSTPGVAGGRLAVVFVNGVLTTTSGVRSGRTALLNLLAGQNDPSAIPASPRFVWYPGYHNPIAAIDRSDAGRCIRELLFLGVAVRGGASGIGYAFLARLGELLRQRQHSECFSTNLRVITDYAVQVMGGTSSLNQIDQKLLGIIERERAIGGNVLLVAHSQGVVIARNVIAALAPDQRDRGCVSLIAAGSPIQPEEPLGIAQPVRAVIARGEENGVRDILWPLWPGRTDGRSSFITNSLDQAWRDSGLNVGLPILGETIATLVQLGTQLSLHSFVDTYVAKDGYAAEIGQWAREAADAMEARCSYAAVEVSAPALVRASEGVADAARVSLINRSRYRTRVRIVPSITDAPSERIAFPTRVVEVELPPRTLPVRVDVPFVPIAGVAPGDYTLRYDVEFEPMVGLADDRVEHHTVQSRLQVSVPIATWVVTEEHVEVTIRTIAGDAKPGTLLSVDLDGEQRREFSPVQTGSSFTFSLTPGRNRLNIYSEQLPPGQLLVGMEVTVSSPVSGGPRRATASGLTTRRSANPITMTIRRQWEVRP